MSKRINIWFIQIFALLVLLLGVQAFAQFEVSPDLFDSPATKQTNTAPATATVATRAQNHSP